MIDETLNYENVTPDNRKIN